MSCRVVVAAAFLLVLSVRGQGQEAPCAARASERPAAVSRAWWEAFALGNAESVGARSATELSFVASNGRSFDQAALIQEATTHGALKVSFEWSDQAVRQAAPTVAVVTGRVLERIGPRSAVYRYVAVLECANDEWQVMTAQSTREVSSSVRVTAAEKAATEDFVGEYRTPLGKNLRVADRGETLVLVDPLGAETQLEPIGPALFEAPGVSFQGVIRFAFARNQVGKVISLTRLTSDVTIFPRVN